MKKGKKMPGQYGHERVTVRNIKLVQDRQGQQPAADQRLRAGPERQLCDY